MNKSTKHNEVQQSAVHALHVLLGLGLVLIIYDYARDFLSQSDFLPTDLSKTSVDIFMSRWITYFGAPILMLVAGVHVGFKRLQGWAKKDIAIYLLKRGVFLLFVDLVIVSFGFNFSFQYPAYFMMLGVLGLSYFVLAGLVFLPFYMSLAVGMAIILGHDIFPIYGQMDHMSDHPILVLLHGMGTVKIFDQMVFLIYSLFPWLGVVLLGYSMGGLYKKPVLERKKLLMATGIVFTISFVVLRLVNNYGNPDHWWPHSETFFSFLSFINVNKFPASAQYLLVTLGPIFILLSWLEGRAKSFVDRFAVFGKAPLFFYICSLYLIHIFAVLAGGLQGYQPLKFIAPVWQFPTDFGFDFFEVLIFSLVLFVAIYPLCRFVDSIIGPPLIMKSDARDQPLSKIIKNELRNF